MISTMPPPNDATTSPPRMLPPLPSPASLRNGSTSMSMASVITLPKLRLTETQPSRLPSYNFVSASRLKEEPRENFASASSGATVSPLGFAATGSPQKREQRSPSSPASFTPQSKFGLAHLLQAAEHCHAVANEDHHHKAQSATRKRPLTSTTTPSPKHEGSNMAFHTNHRLLSIDYLVNEGGGGEEENNLLHGCNKRGRPTLSLDVDVSFDFANHLYHHHHQQYEQAMTTPVYYDPQPHQVYPHMTPMGTQSDVYSQQQIQMQYHQPSHNNNSTGSAKNVWETVLATGNFPDDVCLSENPACGAKSDDNSTVKQGRWTNDEKLFAEMLIQQVRSGQVSLPPNMSLRKFIAESLQCKAMRVSKKFRSLRATDSPDSSSSSSGDDRAFNPLSLHSIMNEDAWMSSDDMGDASPKPAGGGSKTLKRSDYSQHGAVRSGRWSVEEETYAKAMIEAFKCGYLPLHGNVSLRKFLSEVLVCHPMRISKKFVGYVRKYHWYRIAAGKCDPETKRLALLELCQLERQFWASMEQNQEWTAIQQDIRQ